MKRFIIIVFVLFLGFSLKAQELSFFKDSTKLVFNESPFLIPPQKLHPKIIVKKAIKIRLKVANQQPGATLINLKRIKISGLSVKKPQKKPFEFIGSQLKISKQIKAPPLLYRDNATYNIKYLDQAHGALSNGITDIVFDNNQLAWLATEDVGLAKYNGYDFKIIDEKSGLPSNNIKQLLFDSENRLWVVAKAGICYIKNDSLYRLKNRDKSVEYLSVSEDLNHNIWIGTYYKGVFKFKNNTIALYNTQTGLPSNSVATVFQSQDSTYWFGMGDGMGFCHYDGRNFYHYQLPQNRYLNVLAFAEYNGGLLIGTYGNGLMTYKGGQFYDYRTFRPLTFGVYSFVKKAESIWFNIYGFGLGRFKADKFEMITKNDGIPDRNVYRINKDAQDNIWMANPMAGFSRLDENIFYKETYTGVLRGRKIARIVTDTNGSDWFLPNGGILVNKSGQQFTSYINESDSKTPAIQHSFDAYFEDVNHAWMLSFGNGIIHFDKKNYTFYKFKKGYGFDYYKLDHDSNQRIWFATQGGGVIYHDKKGFYQIDKKNGLSTDNLNTLLCGKQGKTWLALENKGLAYIKDDNVFSINKAAGLLSNDISSIFKDKSNRLWLGSLQAGVQMIDGDNSYTFNEKNGLISDNIIAITQGLDKAIWITTSNGLTRIEFDNEAHLIFKNFDKKYGINMTDVSGASKAYKFGEMAFGSTGGLLIYKKENERKSYLKPKLFLEDITVKNLKINKSTLVDKPIKLKQNQKLNIRFYALNWGYENTLNYQYRIASSFDETEWVDLAHQTNLELQKFELYAKHIQIRAISVNGISNVITIPISVRPLFYQNIYYHLLFWFVLIGFTVSYYQYKKRLAIKNKLELERIIKENTKEILSEKEALEKSYQKINSQNKEKDILIQEVHHRVKNNLQLISSLVSMQLSGIKSVKSKKILTETYNRINAMALVHEILYHKENVSYISLKTYLSDLVKSMNEMLNIDRINININKSFEDINIDISYCIALGMITNEAISNAMKYAFKNPDYIKNAEIKLDLWCDSKTQQIVYSIKDNGIGIDNKYLNTENKSLGLRLIGIFSKQLKANLEIKNNRGTEIIVKFKCLGHENCCVKQRLKNGCDL